VAEEFRFVISMEKLKHLSLDPKRSKDFDDYYLSREKRIRYFVRSNDDRAGKFFLIESKPGSIIKKGQEITSEEANNLLKETILLIRKKGCGHISCEGVEGYAEIVVVFNNINASPLFEEVHIEFEENPSKIPLLSKKIAPLHIIKTGLFDYIKTKI
jgi:hypothetical protein